MASNVTLVDSPGLTFPSYYPKPLQILSGLFPIDQVRSPFTAIGFLAERVNLVQTFQLRHLSDEGAWTAWDICEVCFYYTLSINIINILKFILNILLVLS